MNENVMGTKPIKSILWKLGLPMIFSMVLQAPYNVVDTAFVINMGVDGQKANLALTYVFPVQIFMIAVGVGTGIGLNALISRYLGEKNEEGVKKAVGNGIILGLILYVIFLLFGLFLSEPFLKWQTSDPTVIQMGTNYLKICCVLSFGCIGYAIYERFLQASGKTMLSTIAQISGAAINIIFDYVFIYPCHMGIEGAAWATIFGQIVSLAVAMVFHYFLNKEVKNSWKGLLPDGKLIGAIYKVGWSAILMQGLLSVNMFVIIAIFGLNQNSGTLLQGTYGIYYKIMQIALMSGFGLSNAIITLLSYNIGLNDQERMKQTMKYGIIDTLIVMAVITILFESLATPISSLFGLASGDSNPEIITLTKYSIRIASIGYIFMGFSLAIQGILQAYRMAVRPLIISLLRLIVLLVPFVFIFIYLPNASHLVWISFPIAELLTAIISWFILQNHLKKVNLPLFSKKLS